MTSPPDDFPLPGLGNDAGPAGPTEPIDTGAGTVLISGSIPGGEIRAGDSVWISPRPAAPDRPKTFYSIDGRRVTFREYRFEGSLPLAILASVLMKGFRLRFPASSDDPPVESLEPFEVAASELPAEIRDRFAPSLAELQRLGFRDPVYHAIQDPIHRTRTYLASLAHTTRPAAARLHNRIWSGRNPVKDILFTEFITEFRDGTYLWSLSSKPDMLAPPECRVLRMVSAAPAELWAAHDQAVAGTAGVAPVPVQGAAGARALVGRLHGLVRDFHVRRGVFRTPDENEQRLTGAGSSQRTSASRYPTVIVEIDRQLNKRVRWQSAVALLVISLALFLLLGVNNRATLTRLVALVPILVFHECGHLVAMRLCGYRNLRMFFIPGFGAAVTGRSFNVAGWKKAIVSLMGPLPGIGLGIIIGLCGVAFHRQWAVDAGALMVGLNGFNLLPVLPFDGGQVLQTVLFSRHHTLDVFFRIIAALALGALYIGLKSQFFLFLAILMFMSLPMSRRVSQAVRTLRAQGFSPVSPDNQTISTQDADRIVATLLAQATKNVPANLLATQTISVFESLNTRAPGVLASAGLLTLHGLGFAASLVFTFVFILAGRGQFHNTARPGPRVPALTVVASEVRSAGAVRPAPAGPATDPVHAAETGTAGPTAGDTPPSHPIPDSVIATFPDAKSAAAAFAEASAKLAPGERATLLGSSLIIGLAGSDEAPRKRWLGDLRSRAADAFVDGEGMRAMFRIDATAPDPATAKALSKEISDYSALPLREGLIPPWSDTPLTEAQRAARRTYIRMSRVNAWKMPEAK